MTLALDANLSVGERSLGALLAIQAGLEKSNKDIFERLARLEELYQQQGPVYAYQQGTASSDTNGDAFEIGLGGPTPLRKWEVRSIVVGGLTWATTVAGTALVVVGPSRIISPNNLSTTMVRDYASKLPLPAFYSSGQLVVRWPDHLRLLILTPTASTQYVAAAMVAESPDIPAGAVQAS